MQHRRLGALLIAKPQATLDAILRNHDGSRLRFRIQNSMIPTMVIAYHLIWTAYGWWLPNDPRGSMSKCIASDTIAELGALHYGRKRVHPC